MQADLPPTDRLLAELQADGRIPPQPRRELRLDALTWRHHAVVHLMLHGCTDMSLLSFIKRSRREKISDEWQEIELPPPELGEPLPIEEAGKLLGYRMSYCRKLVDQPLFKKALREARRATVNAVGNGDKR